jgi:hypothetical protein
MEKEIKIKPVKISFGSSKMIPEQPRGKLIVKTLMTHF